MEFVVVRRFIGVKGNFSPSIFMLIFSLAGSRKSYRVLALIGLLLVIYMLVSYIWQNGLIASDVWNTPETARPSQEVNTGVETPNLTRNAYCSYCGAEVERNSEFCKSCGHKLR